MRNRIFLFLTVFLVLLVISIYNYDILSSLVPGWHAGKHYFGKFIFVTLVLLLLISFLVTVLVELIKKIIFRTKK